MSDLTHLDPARGSVRAARASVLTVEAVGAAAAAHASSGGCLKVSGLAAAAAVCGPLAYLMLNRCATPLALIAWLATAQTLTHVLLQWACPHLVACPTGAMSGAALGLTPGMVGMHLVTMAVTAVVLSRADAGLWAAQLLVRLAAVVTRLLTAVTTPAVEVVVRPMTALTLGPMPHEVWTGSSQPRRGPPQGSFA